MTSKYSISPEIKKATTLPSSFYRDKDSFIANTELLLSASWQFLGDTSLFDDNHNVVPMVIYEDLIDEPVILIRAQDGSIKCLSNVCTHRGNLLINQPGKISHLVCGYHGRKYSLEGKFESMPEFEGVEDFPRICDHLQQIGFGQWHQFYFASLDQKLPFTDIAKDLNERLGFFDISSFKYAPENDKSYRIRAHWALYCDNYLEGFHIPFVHPGLNQAVEYTSYETILYKYCSLQIGYAKKGVEAFNLPEGHPDYGKKIAAYYYWIFPNLMFNFYPWGLSINIVNPKGPEETEVIFKSYVADATKLNRSAGAGLDEVEMEDEAVVESVQKGMKSRFYNTGRFSPTKEKGVHHFHSLIDKFLSEK